MDKKEILAKLQKKELSKRCLEVGMCSGCGADLKNIVSPSSNWAGLTCLNKECEEYKNVRKTF